MKKKIFAIVLLAFAAACATKNGKEVKSLRGDIEIPAGSNPTVGMDWKPEQITVPRTFVHQPPLVPHAVAEYDISTNDNDCLDCHGDKDSGAPMPHESQFFFTDLFTG